MSPIWAIAAMVASTDPQVDVARRMIRSRLINVFVGAVVSSALPSSATLIRPTWLI